MNILLIVGLCAYAITIGLLSYYFRSSNSYMDFVAGNKSFGWFITACALFTLIGGGELIAGSSFGFSYGWFGVALFAGYTISFILLGLRATVIFDEFDKSDVSYADYARRHYGRHVGLFVIATQIIAFFALIVLQFSAGATLIAQLTSIPFNAAVILCASAVCSYLLIGGFRAVSITDVVQGAVMLLLVFLAAYVVATITSSIGWRAVSTYPGFDASWGVLLSGIVIGLASADVWQRMLTARTSNEARVGFIIGGLTLGSYGTLIVFIGILANVSGISKSGDSAFFDMLSSNLPSWISLCAVLATIAAILSTADTEIFLVSSLVEKLVARRWDGDNKRQFNRLYIVVISILAATASTFGSDLATFYNWMFVLYMIVAPTIALSVFTKLEAIEFTASIAGSCIMFLILLLLKKLTLENAYILAAPAFFVAVRPVIRNWTRR